MVKDEGIKKMFEEVGLTEKDLEKITPEAEEGILNALPDVGKYRLVAEVVRSKFCGSGMRPGMKFVVEDSILNMEETTAPLCLGALEPLYEKAAVLYDRQAQKGDKPISLHMYGYRCKDPGLELDGLGTTEFKVYVEKK